MSDTTVPPLQKLLALKVLSSRYACPWTEFSETLNGPAVVLRGLDLESLKKKGWFPLAKSDGEATVIVHEPTTELTAEIKDTLGVETVHFLVTLPDDLIRIIEHNQDINHGFSPDGGRTPLAKVRTYLAGRRSLLAHYRTLLAKSRTGLAFVRTGISFIAIALLLFRIIGGGLLLFIEIPLLAGGIVMAADSLRRYIPARKVGTVIPACEWTQPTNGTTVLATEKIGNIRYYRRTPEVPGAARLREGWDKLTPLMRRRFLASDRTDLAEERTTLACYRTWMAKVRTGLAFARTGIAFIGLGLGLLRAFPPSAWRIFDLGLIAIGLAMIVLVLPRPAGRG